MQAKNKRIPQHGHSGQYAQHPGEESLEDPECNKSVFNDEQVLRLPAQPAASQLAHGRNVQGSNRTRHHGGLVGPATLAAEDRLAAPATRQDLGMLAMRTIQIRWHF